MTKDVVVAGVKDLADFFRDGVRLSRLDAPAEDQRGLSLPRPNHPDAVKWSLLGALAQLLQGDENDVACRILYRNAVKLLRAAHVRHRLPEDAEDRQTQVRLLSLANAVLPPARIVELLDDTVRGAHRLVQMTDPPTVDFSGPRRDGGVADPN